MHYHHMESEGCAAIGRFMVEWGKMEMWILHGLHHSRVKIDSAISRRIKAWAKLIRQKFGATSAEGKQADRIRDSLLSLLETRNILYHGSIVLIDFEHRQIAVYYRSRDGVGTEFRYSYEEIETAASEITELKNQISHLGGLSAIVATGSEQGAQI